MDTRTDAPARPVQPGQRGPNDLDTFPIMESFLKEHHNRMVVVARGYLRNSPLRSLEDAQDATADAVLRAFRKQHLFAYDRIPHDATRTQQHDIFHAWFRLILRHACDDAKSRSARHPTTELDRFDSIEQELLLPTTGSAEAEFSTEEDIHELRRQIDRVLTIMPDRYSRVISAAYLANNERPEVAAQFKVTTLRLRNRLCEARKRFRYHAEATGANFQ